MLGSPRGGSKPKLPSLSSRKKTGANEALVGLFVVALTAFIVAALYFGRHLLVPLAVAGLLTFMLAPLVAWIERRLGRITAVIIVTVLVSACLGGLAWVLTRQAVDLATRLPDYRSNIEKKLHALELSKDGPIKRLSQMVAEIESEIPGLREPSSPPADTLQTARPERRGSTVAVPPPVAAPVPRAEASSSAIGQVGWMFTPVISVLGTTGIVIVLVIFMLVNREDLRGRIVKMVGQGRISLTTRAMEDAATRVSRYLLTQLLINIVFGAVVTLGLYLIGIPNAFLWGAMSAALRFVPYVGAWMAAFCPIVLSLAVSPGWQMVAYTFGLFAVLELVTANLLEPVVYRSSTGVSSLALIVAAIFWTWLWGPVGLLLATPLTVCVAVIGRHVPRFSFFSVLLGDEEVLTPAEDCYHRLLVGGLTEAAQVIDTYAKAKSLTTMYDELLVPTLALAEMDFQSGGLDDVQRARVMQGLRDVVDEMTIRPLVHAKSDDEKVSDAPAELTVKLDCRVACVPVRAERDEIAGGMLLHALRDQGFEVSACGHGLPIPKLVAWIEEQRPDVVCISLIPPTTVIHARHLCSTLRARLPKLHIMVGAWGAAENLDEAKQSLRQSGADDVVVSFAEATTQLVELSGRLLDHAGGPAALADEDERLATLAGLEAYEETSNPIFDRMTKQLTRTFDVPIALLTLIDRDRERFKSQCGLTGELSGLTELPREQSICTHVVAANAPLVVEDLARDRRFARNPVLMKHQLRFYAGVPLLAGNNQPVGTLCILDTKPRKFSDTEMRLLQNMAREISEQLTLRQSAEEALKPLVSV